MNPEKRREIALLTETVLDSLQLSVPVDVWAAVEKLGGRVLKGALPDGTMEAKITKSGDSFEIHIRADKPSSRKRFSIAHELGHLFLHMGYLVNPDVWRQSGEYRDSVYFRFGHGIEEQEANEFAAAFLMPESEFREAAHRFTTNGRCSLKELADHFKGSKEAARNRGRSLGIFPNSP